MDSNIASGLITPHGVFSQKSFLRRSKSSTTIQVDWVTHRMNYLRSIQQDRQKGSSSVLSAWSLHSRSDFSAKPCKVSSDTRHGRSARFNRTRVVVCDGSQFFVTRRHAPRPIELALPRTMPCAALPRAHKKTSATDIWPSFRSAYLGYPC